MYDQIKTKWIVIKYIENELKIINDSVLMYLFTLNKRLLLLNCQKPSKLKHLLK